MGISEIVLRGFGAGVGDTRYIPTRGFIAGGAGAIQANYALQVDWNNDGDFVDANEDITEDALTVECRRGRDYASQLTGRASAGQLVARLYNAAGKYSPFNTSSPLTGQLLPGRGVRLRVTYPVPITLWAGFLDRIEPESAPGGNLMATLYASGPFVKLAGKRVTPAANAGAAAGTIMTAILDEAGWPAGDRIIDAGNTSTGRWFVEDVDALEAAKQIEDTEWGFLYEGLAQDIVFEQRHHRLAGAHLTSQATFSDAAGAARPYVAIQELDPLRDIYNEFMATIESFTVAGAPAVLWTLNDPTAPTLAAAETKTWWAQYPNAASGGDAGAYVDAWTTPVVGTDITQTGVANGDIAVVATKFARAMKIAVTNNHATAVATLTLVQARGTAVTRDEPVKVSFEDATSQAAYGERSYTVPARWLPNSATGQDYCNWGVSRYKDPLAVLSIAVASNRDLTMMAEALGRAISDRVTVVANGNAGLGISTDFYVEAIAHRVDQGKTRHMTTFELSPVSGDGAYWVLGTSSLGVDTRLGY